MFAVHKKRTCSLKQRTRSYGGVKWARTIDLYDVNVHHVHILLNNLGYLYNVACSDEVSQHNTGGYTDAEYWTLYRG